MKQLFILLTVLLYAIHFQPAFSCSAFIAEESGLVLVGNNEDHWNPFTKMWVVKGENGKLGCVYFGYDDLTPQGGMNEAGLVFDFFATQPNPVTKTLHKPEYQGNLYTKIMEECRTVDDALEVLDQYNLKLMAKYMTFFADKNGGSVIVEGDEIVRKSGNFQAVTNFYQSESPNGVKENGFSACWRFAKANVMLRNDKPFNKEKAKNILAAVSQDSRSKTLYSNIYDVKKGIVYLYYFHDFDNEVVIDLKKELQKENQGIIDIPSLFPSNTKADALLQSVNDEMKKRIGNREITEVSPQILEKYCHSYQHEDRIIKAFVKNDTLHLEFAEDIHAPLQAFSETEFFAQIFLYDFIFTFEKNEQDEVKGFWIHETLYYEGKEQKTSLFFKKI